MMSLDQPTGNDRDRFLGRLKLENLGHVYWNLPTPTLYEEAVRRYEGMIGHMGPLVVRSGQYTGRLPRDKFIVREPSSQDKIWWGNVNREFDHRGFELIQSRLGAYLQGKDIFVQDCYAGADPQFRIPLRIITERAWHSLFARNMFIQQPAPGERADHPAGFTVIQVPGFHADPEIDGTNSDAFVLLHLGKRLVLIGGTAYAGEIKKAVFTVMNYLLPQRQVMAMHCSANDGRDDRDVAVFFGLSGTGKTTLSADRKRVLIGDDEHGWSDRGVFNFEGGCYAKVLRLSPRGEPEIYQATRRFGTILENVATNADSRRLDLDNAALTENTRAAYPITHIPNVNRRGQAGHPRNIIMLTCDAFGVLPPLARLTPEQAMYHFVLGYTAKIAGTEAGITEPKATFSPCFGAPFMALPPSTYAGLLGDKIARHRVKVWLINTGWSGGGYGEGKRIPLSYTRALVRAVLEDQLAGVETMTEPFFGLNLPRQCPGVPGELLEPRRTWKDARAYDRKARELAGLFAKKFDASGHDMSGIASAGGPPVR